MFRNGPSRAWGARCGALSSSLFAFLGACWEGPADEAQAGEPTLAQVEQAVRDGCAPASFARLELAEWHARDCARRATGEAR